MTNKRRNGSTASERLGLYDPLLQRAQYRMTKDAIAEVYKLEKTMGIRLPTGADKLQTLSPMHKKIIALFVQGVKSVHIAEMCDCRLHTVYHTVNDPIAKAWVAQWNEMTDKELEQLMTKGVDAIRDALDSDSINIRLKGVDRMAKMLGRYSPKEGGSGDTAEDVISRILDLANKSVDAVIDSRPERATVINLKPS